MSDVDFGDVDCGDGDCDCGDGDDCECGDCDCDCGDDCSDLWLCCTLDACCEGTDNVPVVVPPTEDPFIPQPIVSTMPILTSTPISMPIPPITTEPSYRPVPMTETDIASVNTTQPVASTPIRTTQPVALKSFNQKPKKPLNPDGSDPNDSDPNDSNANDLNPNNPPPTSNARKYYLVHIFHLFHFIIIIISFAYLWASRERQNIVRMVNRSILLNRVTLNG